jgi:glycosyltransferase involved in cell wall biosynthesis
MAGDTIEFVGWADDAVKAKLFAAARALLVPQEEDFGMVMVEALASGTPVVAFREGGALEILEEGVTGVFFDRQTPEDLIAAIGRLEGFELDREALRERAGEFSPERFDAAMRDVADRVVGRPSPAYAMAAR